MLHHEVAFVDPARGATKTLRIFTSHTRRSPNPFTIVYIFFGYVCRENLSCGIARVYTRESLAYKKDTSWKS